MTHRSHPLRIRQLREAAGLTQRVLADKAGVSRSQLSEIETSSKPTNTLRLGAIAHALGVSVADLIDAPREPWAEEIVHLLGQLDPENREAVLRIIRAMTAMRTP